MNDLKISAGDRLNIEYVVKSNFKLDNSTNIFAAHDNF